MKELQGCAGSFPSLHCQPGETFMSSKGRMWGLQLMELLFFWDGAGPVKGGCDLGGGLWLQGPQNRAVDPQIHGAEVPQPPAPWHPYVEHPRHRAADACMGTPCSVQASTQGWGQTRSAAPLSFSN